MFNASAIFSLSKPILLRPITASTSFFSNGLFYVYLSLFDRLVERITLMV